MTDSIKLVTADEARLERVTVYLLEKIMFRRNWTVDLRDRVAEHIQKYADAEVQRHLKRY